MCSSDLAIAVLLSAIRRSLSVAWRALMPVRGMLRIAIISLLSALPTLALRAVIPGELAFLLTAGAVQLCAYLALDRWSGVLSSADVHFVLRFARPAPSP